MQERDQATDDLYNNRTGMWTQEPDGLTPIFSEPVTKSWQSGFKMRIMKGVNPEQWEVLKHKTWL
jgi:hypothetical protein